MKYTVDDVVIMRTPILCADKYEYINHLEKGNLDVAEILSKHPKFKEAVAISSLDLVKVQPHIL
ncbi:hypothetical protein SAMN05446037_104234 [Anaerovirgula multivorans]|uniref:Uncharacterized protein n=1 Tax=Anaerovirgula multivorans TaxID=312168 RepID=A0A239K3L0_9FIRM|nr:hypothetical protein [Anaerovirgula multivorans]SNT12715.1 hypothetical protein SAMN05446037_104234 [Anaerovirgula multivorans]